MSANIKFRVSVIAAAVSMVMSGAVFAVDGNTVAGPEVTAGTAHVNILQVGSGNVLSGDATAVTPANPAFVVNSGTGALDLTIQQVGTDGGSPTGGNAAAINAYTDNAATKIRIFQGGKAGALGGVGGVSGVANSADIGGGLAGADDLTVTGNKATITLGNSGTPAGASEILVSQQGNGNTAVLTLGSSAFTGVMQVMQLGNTNTADVTVSGQSTSKAFNIGQAGNGNSLVLTAVNMLGDVTANFGGPSFASAFTSSKPAATDTAGGNNAKDYLFTTANGVTGSTAGGINLGSTSGFNLSALGGQNNVQVDLQAAHQDSKVDIALAGSTNFAVYGKGNAVVNLGGTSALEVNASKTLAVYANGGSVAVNGVTFDGNGYFSTSSGGTITLVNGTVTSDGMSVVQSGAAQTFTSNNSVSSSATWDVSQTGPVANSATVTNNASGASFNLTQTSEASGAAHSLTLTDSAGTTGANWTVTQTGAGAKSFTMTNSTDSALINVSQTGALAQSATGITFAAASGSAFNLTQK